jgi:hypothetical protein
MNAFETAFSAMANEARRYAKSMGGASKSGNFMYN